MKLFTNARFFSMRTPGECFGSLLEEDGRITALYPEGEAAPRSIDAERIDLEGGFVYPGFVDTHTHAFEGGLYALCVDLAGTASIADVLEAIAQADTVGGLVIGWNLDIQGLKERRFPTIEELDRIQPELPLLIRRIDGHSSVVNSAAAARIPWPGGIPPETYPLLRQSNRAASSWFHSTLTEEGILAAYTKAASLARRAGLAGLHAMIGDGADNPRHFELIRDKISLFAADFTLYPQIRNIDEALRLGSPRIGGCLLADGSIGSHTAALTRDYADRPGFTAELYETDEHWYRFFRAAHTRDLTACVHAIGDAAVEQIARILRRVYDDEPKPLRHQIIHCEMVNDETLEILSGLPAAAVMQPAFDALWGAPGGLYEEHLGIDGKRLNNRLASLHGADILIAGSSDWYITPLDPLGGIRAAMNISTPGERLNSFDAISLFTRNAALLAGREKVDGLLAPGYRCTLAIASAEAGDPDSRILGSVRDGELLRP